MVWFFKKFSVVLVVLIVVAMLIFVSGCGPVQVKLNTGDGAGVCDRIPEGETSVICELADRAGQSPETVAGIIRLANIGMLAGKNYTAREALDFITGIRGHLIEAKAAGTSIAYAAAVAYARAKFTALSPEAQIAFMVVDSFIAVDIGEGDLEGLSNYDIDMLLAHLDDLAATVAMYALIGD